MPFSTLYAEKILPLIKCFFHDINLTFTNLPGMIDYEREPV